MDEEPTLVSVADLCKRWGLSKQAIYNMRERGEIEAHNLNAEKQATGERKRAQWRIPMSEVLRWEKERQLEAESH